MPGDDFKDITDIISRFSDIGRMGAVGGWFALKEFEMQANRQARFAELASQAMAARRRVYAEAVLTITAQVEAEITVVRLMEKRAQLLQPGGPPAELPGSSPATGPVSNYVSDQEIQDAALSAAVGYVSATDKQQYWADFESGLKAKKWPEPTIAEVRQIATEVIRRTGG